jgi:biotin transport system ATP-binding protein
MAKVLYAVRSLAKRFPDGGTALDGVDLDVLEGECLVIAGSNGSGKTQLMKILAGLSPATSGSIRFEGELIAKQTAKLRRGVGLIFQDADAQIVGETAAEDVAFGPRNLGLRGGELAARVDGALEAVGLAAKRDAAPRKLSGGEKRRLAVAGVLAMGCHTVIMDEPFANLDWPGVVQVLRIIVDLKASGRTVVVLTHELEKVLAQADRLAILHAGRIRSIGAPAEVLASGVAAWGVRDPRHHYDSVEACTWLD